MESTLTNFAIGITLAEHTEHSIRKMGSAKMGKNSKKAPEDEEYVVEDILGHKVEGKERYYKIKWEGYPESECTWEPAANINEVLIKRYEKKCRSTGISLNGHTIYDESSGDESVSELVMKEVLGGRKENGMQQYNVKFSDGSTKWIAAGKIGNKNLIKAYNSKKPSSTTNNSSSRKRAKASSEKDSDAEVVSKKRSHTSSSASFSNHKTPATRNGRSNRRSSIASTASSQDVICDDILDSPKHYDRVSRSKSKTPVISRSQKRKNSLVRENSVSSKRNGEAQSAKSSNSSKSSKSKNKKSKVPEVQKPQEEEEGIYVIEKIVDSRVVNGVKEYRVRWENYPPEDDTWQTIDTFNDPSIVQEFEKLKSAKFKGLGTPAPDSDKSSKRTKPVKTKFLKKLMKKVRRGVTYRDEEIVGVLDKHFNSEDEGFYLVQLSNKQIIYMHPDDVPVKFREECLYADKKRALDQ
uniref:Chromo domain-containing protein n=1 Tax=Strongyloides venezuelensis TaxID=75913 RepID=A0A0K0F506_STRVS